MVFEQIDKLKQAYTDKYVVVDESRPELRRFNGLTGMVKTVNMSGRALVEFDGYANIGWYDIDLDFLKVVDKPVEVVEEKKAPAKEPAAKKPAAEKAAAPGKKPAAAAMSVEDMLAAARGNKPAVKAAEKKPATGGLSVEDMLAAARGEKGGAGAPAAPAPKQEAAAPAAKTEVKSMSVEEMLAAARGEKSGTKPVAVEPEPVAVEPEPVAAEPEPVAAEPAAAAAAQDDGDIPTDIAGVLAWCRQHDGS
jgi:hypothetical protein